MTWPQGSVPFNVEVLVRAAREVAAATIPDAPENVKKAQSVVATASEYVLGLPEADQHRVARELIQEMEKPMAFKAGVAPRKPRRQE